MPTRVAGSLAAVLTLLLGLLASCGGDDDKATAEGSARPERPAPALTKGNCWVDEQLPDALGAGGFESWVEKHAGGEARLGEAMRDDAAYRKDIDCSEPHSPELYSVIEVSPALTARVERYADLLDQ